MVLRASGKGWTALISVSLMILTLRPGIAAAGADKAVTQPLPRAKELPIAVDGARSPEAIPDRLAYIHFLMSVATTEGASADEISHRDALVERIGLEPEDAARLRAVVQGLADALVRIERQRVGGMTPAATSELNRQRDGLLTDAQTRMAAALSKEGRSRVDEHVRTYVKRHIVIYGDLP